MVIVRVLLPLFFYKTFIIKRLLSFRYLVDLKSFCFLFIFFINIAILFTFFLYTFAFSVLYEVIKKITLYIQSITLLFNRMFISFFSFNLLIIKLFRFSQRKNWLFYCIFAFRNKFN